MAPKRVY